MLAELVKSNRSYRSFDERRRISRGELTQLVELARACPSASNRQPLKYYLCTDEAECAQFLALTKWAALLKDVALPPAGHAPAAYILICRDETIATAAADIDLGIAAQTMMLGAAELGLGGCMIMNFEKREMKSLLNLAETLTPRLVLALGRPDEEVRLVAAKQGGTDYWRQDGVHHVPKRPLDALIINS